MMTSSIKQLFEMYDNVEREYQSGEIDWDEKESRQKEIMQTMRVLQP